MKYRLLTIENPADEALLKRPAKRVKNVQSTEVVLGIQAMKRIAHEWEAKTGMKCEGLAATQIGWNARVMILRASDEMKPVDPETVQENWVDQDGRFDQLGYVRAYAEYKEWNRVRGGVYDPWIVMINPVIVQEEGFQNSIEGCLSVPGSLYEVVRPTHVAFKYTRPNRTYSGVHLARTAAPSEQLPQGDNSAVKFRHEFDHLQGILLPMVASRALVGESTGEPL